MKTSTHSSHEDCYLSIQGINLYLDFFNKRLKIMDDQSASDHILKDIIDLAENRELGKIISKCRFKHLQPFRNRGFVIEGTVNGYFRGVRMPFAFFILLTRKGIYLTLVKRRIFC